MDVGYNVRLDRKILDKIVPIELTRWDMAIDSEFDPFSDFLDLPETHDTIMDCLEGVFETE